MTVLPFFLSFLLQVPAPPPPLPAEALQVPGQTWVCPMHPDVRTETESKCPLCGMALVVWKPDTYEPFLLDASAKTSPLRMQLDFSIKHPNTQQTVANFNIVHERPVHVFVVSSDLGVFDHVHPDPLSDGMWRLNWDAPKPGRYHVFMDVVPVGALPQLLETVVNVPGPDRRAASANGGAVQGDGERVVARSSEQHGTRVGLDTTELVAGEWSRLTFKLTDSASGAAVDGWEPWLGSWAHLFTIRSGATEPQHAHPDQDSLVQTSAATSVALDVLFPRAGDYSLWLQLQRNGQVLTLPFKVDVAPAQ